LITLLSNPRTEVHRDAAGALWSLSASSANQKLIAKSDGIAPLVALLNKGIKGAQETAAGALHGLATLPENRTAIADAGGIPALTAVFEHGTEEAKVEAAGAISTLVLDNAENQIFVAAALVEMLKNDSLSPSAQEHLTKLVYNLALDPENRDALARENMIPQLAKQLRGGSSSCQLNAASALSQIALTTPQHRVQVTAELILLLGADSMDVRQRAFTALQDMSKENTSNSRMTVKTAGGIDGFVTLLREGSLEAQEYALWLLWQSTDLASKKSIAMACCAKPIVTILVTDKLSDIAKQHAASVLSGMTSSELGVIEEYARATNKEDVIAGGGVPPLVKLLKTGSMAAKKHAALTIAQLCYSAEGPIKATQLSVLEAGAIPPLVDWLNDPSLGQPAIAARVMAELCNENEATQNATVAAGAVRPLVAMMISGSIEEQKWAAAALAAMLLENERSQTVLVEEGGIRPLVVLLEREDIGPHEHATRAVWHLCTTIDNQLAIAAEGCLPALVSKLSCDITRAKWAAAALEALSLDCTENQVSLARVGAITPLVALLGSESEATQLYAQSALLNIAMVPANRAAVVKPLVELLSVRNAAAQMKSAESLVMLISRHVENRMVVAQAGAIPPLVGLLGDGRNVSNSQVCAATALGDLARMGESKQAIIQAGGVEPLVAMLLSPDVEAHTRAAIAVCQLAASTSAQQLIADANAIPYLVRLLSSGHAIAAMHAAGALWHLESLASTKAELIAAGGIAALIDLLGHMEEASSLDGQDAIAALLSDLARGRGGAKAAIVQRGGIPHLVKLLEQGSTVARKHAACAIWGLTSEPAFQKPMLAAGAVPLLIQLLTGDQKAQGYAAAALNNLACDKQARELLQKGSVVELLNAICEGTESWLRSQAMGILQQLGLSVPAARGIVQEMALRIAAVAEQQLSYLEESLSPRRRGWDATSRNPIFESEHGAFDHLLFSPRNDAIAGNTYQRVQRARRRIDEEAAEAANAPLDFDRPHPRVIAAIEENKKRSQEASQVPKEQPTSDAATPSKAPKEQAASAAATPTKAPKEQAASAAKETPASTAATPTKAPKEQPASAAATPSKAPKEQPASAAATPSKAPKEQPASDTATPNKASKEQPLSAAATPPSSKAPKEHSSSDVATPSKASKDQSTLSQSPALPQSPKSPKTPTARESQRSNDDATETGSDGHGRKPKPRKSGASSKPKSNGTPSKPKSNGKAKRGEESAR